MRYYLILVCGLFLSLNLNANIQYINFLPNINVENQSPYFELNVNGIIQVRISPNNGNVNFGAYPGSDFEVRYDTDSGLIDPLLQGMVVDGSGDYTSHSRLETTNVGTTYYVPYRFMLNNNLHHGWISIIQEADNNYIGGYAWEDIPGQLIVAGDTGGSNGVINFIQNIMLTTPDGSNTISGLTGSLVQLSTDIVPSDATNMNLIWSSSDENIASMDPHTPGQIIIHNSGVVIISATATDGSDNTGNLPINVDIQAPIATSVSISSSTGNLSIDENDGDIHLFANVLPAGANQEVSWNVDNGSIASITSGGQLIALKNGTVSVSAMATDGSGMFGVVNVTISNQIILAESIDINSENNNDFIDEVGGQLQMLANVLPIDASQSITWSISDPTIATIDSNGLITAMEDGEVQVFAMTIDGTDLITTKTIIISNQALSNEDFTISNQIKIWPNPAIDHLTIDLPESIQIESIAIIYNQLGQKVAQLDINNNNIQLTNLTSGQYLLSLRNDQDIHLTKKFIIR